MLHSPMIELNIFLKEVPKSYESGKLVGFITDDEYRFYSNDGWKQFWIHKLYMPIRKYGWFTACRFPIPAANSTIMICSCLCNSERKGTCQVNRGENIERGYCGSDSCFQGIISRMSGIISL